MLQKTCLAVSYTSVDPKFILSHLAVSYTSVTLSATNTHTHMQCIHTQRQKDTHAENDNAHAHNTHTQTRTYQGMHICSWVQHECSLLRVWIDLSLSLSLYIYIYIYYTKPSIFILGCPASLHQGGLNPWMGLAKDSWFIRRNARRLSSSSAWNVSTWQHDVRNVLVIHT